ncbi:MAG: ABC-2 family transporter protein [Planctomycetota bacterium]
MSDDAVARPFWSLLGQATVYELRKQVAFRVGFLIREVSHGIVEPLVMLFVFWALYDSAGEGASLRGWTFPELVRYLAGLLVVRKIVFHNRALDLSTQIFEGRVTKYLVMPMDYFVLAAARFAQYTALQLGVGLITWCLGAALAPAHWLFPTSALAVAGALTLVLLGSWCCFLVYYILNALAFWLDVVWSLLVMAWFVISFAGGAILPVSQMPAPVARVLEFGFPYWAISAPIEVLMGRLGASDIGRGLVVLGVTITLLEVLRRVVWRRGLAHYGGAGM